MAQETSIASTKDKFSKSIDTMRKDVKALDQDLDRLQTKLKELSKTRVTLKIDTDKASDEIKKVERGLTKANEASNKLSRNLANTNYDKDLSKISKASGNYQKVAKELDSTLGLLSKAGKQTGSAEKEDGSNVLGDIAASAAIDLIDSMSNAATTWIGSAYGEEAGILTGSVLSSALAGAAMGTIIPGVGNAVGAAVGAIGGAVVGYIQGQNAIFENKDDAFKSYYQDSYNKALEAQSQSLTNGSGIASAREVNKIQFSTLLGGDGEVDKFLGALEDFASVTPYSFEDLASISRNMLADGFKQEELLPLLEKVGDAGSALGMSKEDMASVATTLGRMQTTGETTMEDLNLLDKHFDVWSYLSKEYPDKSKEDVKKMVSEGEMPGGEAAKAITDHMDSDYAGNMEKQSQTYAGLVSTLEESKASLDNAMGEGFNSTRKVGIQEQIDWLSGETGQEMQDAYNKIGQWKASLENQSEQYERDAINSVMSGTIQESYQDSSQKEALERLAKDYSIAEADYYDATKSGNAEAMQEASAVMGRALAEAQVIATNEYNASEGAQIELESNRTLAENIKNDAAAQDEYWKAGYTMGQQFTLGLKSAMDVTADEIPDYAKEYMKNSNIGFGGGYGKVVSTGENKVPYNSNETPAYAANYFKNHGISYGGSAYGRGKAYGLSYVPYNNYSALLHEGERVLTASENRNYGKSTPISITGNSFVVREEADIQKVASKIANMINRAYILAPQ
ncbi:MAG: phage tape measure protein [Herbinix sp.]|jgi:tape measure domain-containing protein|nr:phage tape measure protein [Herbinix sp.]